MLQVSCIFVVLVFSHFSFEDNIFVLIVSVHVHCLLFYFFNVQKLETNEPCQEYPYFLLIRKIQADQCTAFPRSAG